MTQRRTAASSALPSPKVRLEAMSLDLCNPDDYFNVGIVYTCISLYWALEVWTGLRWVSEMVEGSSFKVKFKGKIGCCSYPIAINLYKESTHPPIHLYIMPCDILVILGD